MTRDQMQHIAPGHTHHIRHCRFYIQADNGKEALQLHSRISSLIRTRLFGIVDEVFSEMGREGTARIGRLKIDLGDILLSGLEENVEEKLRSLLRDALNELLFQGGRQGAGSYPFKDTAHSGLEKLQYFLLYGYFPWWADRNTVFEELFGEMMDLCPQQLLALVKDSCRQDYVIGRIVLQSEGGLLVRLIQKMGLPFERFIIGYISDVNRAHQRSHLVKAGSRDFERTVWELTLSYLLMDRGTQFNKKAFVKWNIGQIAHQYGMKYESLLIFLADCLKKTSAGFSFQNSLMAIIGKLTAEHQRSEAASAIPGRAEEEGPALRSFENFLMHGELVPVIDDHSPADIFSFLLGNSRDRIRQLIEDLGYNEGVQERIRRALPVSEVVQLVEPDEYEFIVGYASELNCSHQANPAVRASSEDFEKVVWKFVLNYLMNDRGSDFNRKAFIRWNLTRIAAQYNTSYSILLDFMLESLQMMPSSLAGESSLPDLFEDLAQDLGPSRHPHERAGSLSSGPEAAGYFQSLAGRLLHSTQAEDPEIRRALKEYMRESPAACRRTLLSMAVTDPGLPAGLARICGEEEGELLGLLQPGSASFLKEYSRWIREAIALGMIPGGAKDRERYHEILLRRLLCPGGKIFNAASFVEETLHEILEIAGNDSPAGELPGALGQITGFGATLVSVIGKAIAPAIPASSALAAPTAATALSALTPGSPTSRKKLPRTPAKPKTPQATPRKPLPGWTASSGDDDITPIYIRNAGLILLHPYFPRYFELLQLTQSNEDGRKQFRDTDAIYKGIHALQYLVGGATDSPEQELPLNKLLCGYPLHEPVTRSEPLDDTEKEIAGSLLLGVIQNWPTIRGSSTEALRSFLQREGKLRQREDRWDLEVENKTVDILIEHIPWSITIIKQDWMEQPLYIKWRK